jgi:hypothetical protein
LQGREFNPQYHRKKRKERKKQELSSRKMMAELSHGGTLETLKKKPSVDMEDQQ